MQTCDAAELFCASNVRDRKKLPTIYFINQREVLL